MYQEGNKHEHTHPVVENDEKASPLSCLYFPFHPPLYDEDIQKVRVYMTDCTAEWENDVFSSFFPLDGVIRFSRRK